MSAHRRKPAAILISGRGSNMEALIAAAAAPGFPASIDLVISDQPDAAGLRLAAQAGVPTRVVARKDFASKEAHDDAIDAALNAARIELVCLAGYMRLLTQDFVDRWFGRMINIHPALLPAFKGLDTHARVLQAGARIHGCTVHFVTFEMDEGPVIAQAAVPVMGGDTTDALAARVLKAEHRLYPRALALVAGGKVALSAGRAVWRENADAPDGAALFSPPLGATDAAPDLQSLARLTP